ncbi:hypothetical protein Tco_1028033 [Tanacetum coccineum]
MSPKRTPMSSTTIEQLIAQRVADAMTAYVANQNSGNGINNETNCNVGGVEPTTRRIKEDDDRRIQPEEQSVEDGN